MIIHEQDIYARLDVSMLVSIVEQYDVSVLSLVISSESFYSVTAVFIHSHIDVIIFLVHLVRLVADVLHYRVRSRKDVSFALSLVSS